VNDVAMMMITMALIHVQTVQPSLKMQREKEESVKGA
jgi:hypothetical protein